MNEPLEEGDDSLLDLEDYQVERALCHAALDAIYRARRCGTDCVISEGGTVRSLKPNETAPYEKRLLEDVERLNRKIAELQALPAGALSQKDRPNS